MDPCFGAGGRDSAPLSIVLTSATLLPRVPQRLARFPREMLLFLGHRECVEQQQGALPPPRSFPGHHRHQGGDGIHAAIPGPSKLLDWAAQGRRGRALDMGQWQRFHQLVPAARRWPMCVPEWGQDQLSRLLQ
ncbi:hypothetical protein CIB84_015477 [Bambusicola thoracicus]|uniref:Uncharacterized protein n=1 Tax=Bambusicola thoracicus TaxID=9083 RepID=A0A2P4S9K4_BAMTH|nr:hypothetical protein CIB84_015477 [Bambusicola thoracicus]